MCEKDGTKREGGGRLGANDFNLIPSFVRSFPSFTRNLQVDLGPSVYRKTFLPMLLLGRVRLFIAHLLLLLTFN